MGVDLRQSRPRRVPGLVVRQRGGEYVVEDATGKPRFTLNATALAVWDLCDGTTTPAEMVDAMCALFDAAPDEVASDVARVFADLLALELVEVTEALAQ